MSSFLENNANINEEAVAGFLCSILTGRGFSVKPLRNTADNDEVILVEPDNLLQTMTFLKEQPELMFSLLVSVSGVDNSSNFEVVYHLYSPRHAKKLVIKTRLDKNNPVVESLSGLFSTANWHERETYDLMGIQFNNHPDLRRILLPDEWKGYPLRKDYKMDDTRLAWNER